MNTAILRLPSPSLTQCELTHIERIPIDIDLAGAQHRSLAEILQECNYNVVTLPAIPELPDSVFVEDTALVVPEAAYSLPLGTGSRQPEAEFMLEHLSQYRRDVRIIKRPASIDGGDVLRIGKKLYVGVGSRTNRESAGILAEMTREWGYETIPVEVEGSLHLKTAVTAPDDETVLLNPDWVNKEVFRNYRMIEIDQNEPFAANILRLGERIVSHKGFPGTISKLSEAGFEVIETDISEFLKAEAGLTCLCLLFEEED
jgi:dimethylargininase